MNKNKKENVPEWEIFKRIEELETVALELMDKTAVVEPTMKNVARTAADGYNLATLMFLLLFEYYAKKAPSQARVLKDTWVDTMKSWNISAEALKALTNFMISVCDKVEKSINH